MSAFTQIIHFALTGNYQPTNDLFRAENRNEISGRLLSWSKLIQQNGFDEEISFLITSVVGEIANNSFDHNLGKWKDQRGCLVGFDFLSDRLRIAVVDRGQGIVESLKAVRPGLQNLTDYLVMAFESIISGRAPEQRGNGLKYVRKNFLAEQGIELFCLSSGLKYKLGAQNQLESALASVTGFSGTLIAIDWKKAGQ